MRMRAAFIDRLGPPQSIRVGDLPVPGVGPTDVLVAVDLVAANHVDTFVRSGSYPTRTPFPFVVGRDLVGTVAASGQGARFAAGDRVWCNSLGHEGRQGSFAEYAAVPADRCYPLPAGVDDATAVAVAHPAATAYLGWFEHAKLQPDEVVYVGGAAGNVGSAATAMAHRAGATVLASARPAEHDRCRAAGADVVVDHRDESLNEQLRAAAPDGVDVFWDTSGRNDLDLMTDVIAVGGRVLLTAAAASRPALPVASLYTHDVSLHGFVISRATTAQLTASAELINDMLADGSLTARVSDVLPLAATAQVHARLEAGQVDGRILLRP